MKNNLDSLKKYIVDHPVIGKGLNVDCLYKIPYRNHFLTVLSSSGGGWEHVGIGIYKHKRFPNRNETRFVEELFWDENEIVIQFHLKKSKYVNDFRILHLWKKIGEDFELPSSELTQTDNLEKS